MPLFYYRGGVYLVRFLGFESPRTEMQKYAVCLQQGTLVEKRQTFAAVIMNSCKNNRQPRLYLRNTAHRERCDRSIVNAPIGHRERSAATLAVG